MELKKFTVVDTRTNKTKVIESSANTVGQLKADLRNNGINPDGMAIQEGITKTELGDDGSYLPHDVPYKGGTTNNLVFRLTQREKKIKSGAMTRKEAFEAVKRLGLTEKIQSKYARNFTQVSTADLINEIEAASRPEKEPCPCGKTNVSDAITTLVEKLVDNGVLDEEEGNEVVGLLSDETTEEEEIYSESEINKMFLNM